MWYEIVHDFKKTCVSATQSIIFRLSGSLHEDLLALPITAICEEVESDTSKYPHRTVTS
jgi:hypothetical protein